MFDHLPGDGSGLMDCSWAYFEPYYRDLAQRRLSADNIHTFLTDWTRLVELIDETGSRLHVAITVNTADKDAEKRYHRFLDEVYPGVEKAEQELKTALLRSGLEPEGFGTALRRMRTESEIFREVNIPLSIDEHKLCNEYDKIMGAQTVVWEERELTIAQMRPLYQSTDRDSRERAWRMAAGRQLQDSRPIGDLWQKLMNLRTQMARNAGLEDYRSFRWRQLLRFDYNPEDCMSFHDAIEEVVVPAAARVYERRRERLGLASLRPWDLEVDPMGRPPLKPFKEVPELIGGASKIFRQLGSPLGDYFDTMKDEGLLDLENRKNKAPGGYCTEFPAIRRPFIFMNAVGIHDDVQTLLHEAGHCFHCFESAALPYYQQRHVGMEFAEVASMSMELLAARYLEKQSGGFYSPADATRAGLEHLEKNILFWPYMAVVDAFQHWVYMNPSASIDPAACDSHWEELCERFLPGVDWDGLKQELRTGWQRKLHIHTVPFYYVEYGMALLGAVQVWKNSLTDEPLAIRSYRRALALGGTVPLPELFQAAGASFGFDAGTLRLAVSAMEEAIDKSH